MCMFCDSVNVTMPNLPRQVCRIFHVRIAIEIRADYFSAINLNGLFWPNTGKLFNR